MIFEKNLRFDPLLAAVVIILTAVGMVMIYSTSAVAAYRWYGGDSAYFLKRQLLFAGVGFTAMFAAMYFNHELLPKLSWPLLVVSLALLIAVLIPGIGTEVKGARRWIRFGEFGFQPSELARFALVVFLASELSRKEHDIKSFKKGFLPYLAVTGVMCVLVLAEKDMGGAITMAGLMLVMLFVAGARVKYLLASVLASLPAVFFFLVSEEYRWRRVVATINPWKYWDTAGWQLVNSFFAFGSGGLFGAGLGQGRQKLFYVPDAHTDFILTVIAEEFGFIGVSAIVLLFGIAVWRGARAAMRSPSLFSAYLAFGITAMIGLPALVNMMVVVGLLPTKGLVLPFISYGGSSLVVYLTASGVLLNVSAKMYRTR